MTERPTGTLTLLFTDIEGSTRLLQALGDRYGAALAEHRALLREAFTAHHGYEVDTQGDAFFVGFSRAVDAAAAAIAGQRALARASWPGGVTLRVRMALHTGEPLWMGDGYTGLDVHRAARLCGAGHGGQILLSQTSVDLLVANPPPGAEFSDLGLHRLKDIAQAERVYQLRHPELPAEFPPLRVVPMHNLPAAPTSLLGRESEVAAVGELILRQPVRMVTLTGAGGIGKTRLALAAAHELLNRFPDGVYFVAVAHITDPAVLIAATAQVLGVRDTGVQPLQVTLAASLRARRALLVFDNFEQVTAAAPIVSDLLGSCPELRVLVTSRVPLHLRGEHEFPVPPLALPVGRLTPDALPPSVMLFAERARAVQPDFQVTPTNAAAVAEICRRLDGLPLAIELAAARIKMLSPEAIAGRLDRRLGLLAGGPQDAPARQRTMRDTIVWSHGLLDPDDQAMFRRLAVFTGGWALEAAEEVCALAGTPALDVMDRLMSLVDQTLIQLDAGGSRYSMYETLREFALERLAASGEAEGLRRQHAEYFLRLAETAAPQLRDVDQDEWLARLERDHDNLRSALGWALAHGHADLGLRLAAGLWWFWHVRGHWGQAALTLETAVASARALGPTPALAEALAGIGDLAGHRCDFAKARAALGESIAIWRELGSKRGLADALGFLAGVQVSAGDYAAARSPWDESIALLREIGDRRGLAKELGAMGRLALHQGDLATARPLLQESVAFRNAIGDKWVIAQNLNLLGDLARVEGDYAGAKVAYSEGLSLSQALSAQGDLTAGLLHNLGWVAHHEDARETSRALFTQSIRLYRELADARGIAECLIGLAALAARDGRHDRAAVLIGAAAAELETIGASVWASNRSDYERTLGVITTALEDRVFRECHERGRTMPRNMAMEYALSG